MESLDMPNAHAGYFFLPLSLPCLLRSIPSILSNSSLAPLVLAFFVDFSTLLTSRSSADSLSISSASVYAWEAGLLRVCRTAVEAPLSAGVETGSFWDVSVEGSDLGDWEGESFRRGDLIEMSLRQHMES